MISGHDQVDVFVGLDVGKSDHHGVALDRGGKVLFDRALPSGNLQFMTDENSFLVPWVPAVIPAGAEPYPAGGTWADPDLDAAARMMRSVIEDPAGAAARGARAASDVATLHSPAVAGRQIAAQLKESAGRRRATSLRTLSRRLRTSDRAARTAFE